MPETYSASRRRPPQVLLLLVSLLALLWLGSMLVDLSTDGRGGGELHVYCAAGMRLPLEEAAAAFREETGTEIILEHGSSGELEGKIALETESGAARADIYIPADRSFTDRAADRGLVKESFPLARFQVVIAVKPGNPRGIQSLEDLLQDDVGYVLCNEEAGVGKRTMRSLVEAGVWEKIHAGVRATKPRVTEAAMVIKTSDGIDAGFIWNTEAKKNGLDFIEVPELATATSTVTAAVTGSSENVTGALRFCRFLASPDHGSPAFARHSFDPVPGDPWDETPEIVLFSGGVNRIAVEDTVREFERREGCRITVNYAGCGLLVQSIKAAADDSKPDVFLTCDASYMPMVGEFFGDATDVSKTAMGFLTRKGSGPTIEGLGDLARDDVDVGIADPDKTALGALTMQLLDAAGVREAVASKMITTPSAHELRLMLEAHSDKPNVAIVYEANAQGLGSDLEFRRIDHPLAHATQNIAVGRGARFPALAARLQAAIHSKTSRERFTGKGFSWMRDLETP